MRKFSAIFFCYLFYTYSNYGQLPSNLKEGGYLSFNSLLNNSPDYNSNFSVSKRTQLDISMAGGNDYKVSTEPKKNDIIIKKNIWFIYSRDTLYVNGIFINGYSHYCKIENTGRYLYFKSGIPKKSLYNKYGFKDSMIGSTFFLAGGNLGGTIREYDLALVRHYYFLDVNVGDVKLLLKENLLQLLAKYPELNNEFLEDQLNNFQFVQTKYLDKINSQ